VGTFQFFAGRRDEPAIRALADHVIARHYPEASQADNPIAALLGLVIERQAELVARWQLVGFIHGVMNTDNMSIAGETMDYGPCAFMDSYHPDTVYSSIDHRGRYAFGNQPSIAHWNLGGLANALLPLISDDPDVAVALATELIQTFPDRFEHFYRAGLQRKLGLTDVRDDDVALAQDLLTRMAENAADFTLTFRRLCDLVDESSQNDELVSGLFEDPAVFDEWAVRWRHRLASEGRSSEVSRSDMRSVNPAFIPRNHRVEEAIKAAVEEGDLEPFEQLIEVLASPYDDQPSQERYATPPRPDQIVRQTFCGT
jgi:uncharacterized protein YdiU (UPF0061 family)